MITKKKYRFEIPEGKKKERIDLFLTGSMENATRSKVQKLIEAKLVTVNKKYIRPSYHVQASDIIEVEIPVSPRPEYAEPEDIPLDIIFEDDYLLVINKPAGMVVHPAYANYTGTLVNALLYHTKKLSRKKQANPAEPERPGIVHRIDKDTSGLIIAAKDDWTHAKLSEQFANHTIEREYWAVAWGIFKEKNGEIGLNIIRSKSDRKKFSSSRTEGKTALTIYEVLKEFDFSTLLKLKLKTGRTHQIRVHLASIGHPVFGDPTYGGRKVLFGTNLPKIKSRVENLLEIMKHQALHAKTIGFFHPVKKEFLRFDSELPEDMQSLITKL